MCERVYGFVVDFKHLSNITFRNPHADFLI
jgi:hypothetical protein